MRHNFPSYPLAALFIYLMLPVPADAMPAITCHCFRDRSFDAARPAAADGYFLATTQNSFFAALFKADKKTIVMKKQQGTSPDDLWIAYWIASKSAASPETLLQAKVAGESWKNVIAPLRLAPKSMGERFSTALNANAATGRLAEVIVDEIFLKAQLLGEGDLTALRKAGATNQELIIATVIATRTRQPAQLIYREVKSSAKTWGSLLSAAKIDSKNMQQELTAILKLRPL